MDAPHHPLTKTSPLNRGKSMPRRCVHALRQGPQPPRSRAGAPSSAGPRQSSGRSSYP
jgi:hypothetical protein